MYFEVSMGIVAIGDDDGGGEVAFVLVIESDFFCVDF